MTRLLLTCLLLAGCDRDAELQARLAAVRMGVEQYAMDHPGSFPTADQLAAQGYVPADTFKDGKIVYRPDPRTQTYVLHGVGATSR